MESYETTRNLISPCAAANLLGFAESTLRRWRAQGIGPPYYPVGGRIRYDIGELESWLASNRNEGGKNE